MAMNTLRLLKNRRHGTSIVGGLDDDDDRGGGSWERKRKVVITTQRAMAPPTFMTLGDDIVTRVLGLMIMM